MQNLLLCPSMLHTSFPWLSAWKEYPFSIWWDCTCLSKYPAKISSYTISPPSPLHTHCRIPFKKEITSLLAFSSHPTPSSTISFWKAGPWITCLYTPGTRPAQSRCSVMLSKCSLTSDGATACKVTEFLRMWLRCLRFYRLKDFLFLRTEILSIWL